MWENLIKMKRKQEHNLKENLDKCQIVYQKYRNIIFFRVVC